MPDAYRKSLIRIIHTARRALAWDETTYRSFLENETGKTSCADLTMMEAKHAVNALRGKGFTPLTKRDPWLEHRQLRLIRGAWLYLHGLKAVDDRKDTAIMAYIQRMTGELPCIPPSEAAATYSTEQLSTVIESLKRWVHRVEEDKGITNNWFTPSK